jgi:hypothetical protein
MRLVLCLMVGALVARPAAADQAAAAGVRKQASASRVADEAIRVDGRLDEEVWLGAIPITDFVQKEPIEGAPPTDAMEVRFVYDDSALYVGARMFSRVDAAIQAPLARRDNGDAQAEYVLISLDTFLDRRTAYDFGVTASGVRLDRYHSTDRDDVVDAGFNPVWEARTAIGADGWTAELWIPLSQLRFNPQRDLIWGLNIRRFRPTLDEDDYWVLVPRTERVWASRFGDLQGISALRPHPSSRAAALRGERVHGAREPRSAQSLRRWPKPLEPCRRRRQDGDRHQPDAGPDDEPGLRAGRGRSRRSEPVGVRDALHREAAVLHRGAQLLNINHPNFFYSRRIGARPRGAATGDFIDYPLVEHDSRRGQADRPPAVEDLDRHPLGR